MLQPLVWNLKDNVVPSSDIMSEMKHFKSKSRTECIFFSTEMEKLLKYDTEKCMATLKKPPIETTLFMRKHKLIH